MIVALLIATSCASTTPKVTGVAADIARDMITNGAPLNNIRNVSLSKRKATAVSDSKGFDIPGVDLKGTPAGVIKIYKDAKQAEFDANMPMLLGGPGSTTRQPFAVANGTAELELDYRLDPELAEVYLNVFRTVEVAGITP